MSNQSFSWRMTSRRIVAAALSLSLVATPAMLCPQQAVAASSEELQAQLDEAYARLDELAYAAQVAEAELGKANWDLYETQEAIEELKVRIEENKALLASKQESLSAQVALSYKNGPARMLDVILDSTTFDDFVTRLFYANRVSNQLSKTIAEVKALREELDAQQLELEQHEAELEVQIEESQAKLAAMEAAQAEQSAYIDELSEELKAAIEEERRKAAEEARRQAEEAARREAEEEARRQAEAAAAAAQQQGGSSDDGGWSVDPSLATDDQRSTAVNAALSQVGLAYIWGEQIPGAGFDCNGLTNWAWAQAGVEIPYRSGTYSYGQFQWLKNSGRWVSSVSQMLPGDLVFYSYDGGYTCYHVAMYIGGGSVVHAIDYSHGIAVTSYDWCYGFCGGGSPI